MSRDLRELACWLALAFESRLPIRVINTILVIWCKQLGRTLQAFFAAGPTEWQATCQLQEEALERLVQAREKLVGQAFLAEQLQHDRIQWVTVLDAEYPHALKSALGRSHIPPMLFYMGDLQVLQQRTVAIIGSRGANQISLDFARATAAYLSRHDVNVISGNARGVDRTAYEGALAVGGYSTIVLPHGINKLSKTQMRELLPQIEAGKVLLLSQFHPNAPWLVSRAMERNQVVTGLAQIVVVAESDTKGGTWEGALGALKQGRRLYVRSQGVSEQLSGNQQLVEKGGISLRWPTPADQHAAVFMPLLRESTEIRNIQKSSPSRPDQLSLLAVRYE